ncbi:NAD-dependent epimerase/dehydratase family protein, partial [Lactiplantibacillus plantarum]
LSILTDCLNNKKPFTLYGDGSQTRDFVYVEDVIQALWLIT